MNRKILRTGVAIASGWIVAAGGYILTVIVFSLFNPDTFSPGVPLPAGWLLVTLAVSGVWSVVAGFVTGVFAGRRETEHAIGLAFFTLILLVCFVHWNRNLGQVPTWYVMAGGGVTCVAILAGGWLCRRQRDLPGGASRGAVDRWGFWGAAVVTGITFLACFWALALGAGEGVLW